MHHLKGCASQLYGSKHFLNRFSSSRVAAVRQLFVWEQSLHNLTPFPSWDAEGRAEDLNFQPRSQSAALPRPECATGKWSLELCLFDTKLRYPGSPLHQGRLWLQCTWGHQLIGPCYHCCFSLLALSPGELGKIFPWDQRWLAGRFCLSWISLARPGWAVCWPPPGSPSPPPRRGAPKVSSVASIGHSARWHHVSSSSTSQHVDGDQLRTGSVSSYLIWLQPATIQLSYFSDRNNVSLHC